MTIPVEEFADVISKALGEVAGICDTSRSEDLALAAVILAAVHRKMEA